MSELAFFLLGFIAGVVSMVMLGVWFGKRAEREAAGLCGYNARDIEEPLQYDVDPGDTGRVGGA